ncbi:MAG: hypothetical protein KQI62_07245 [Deltaproteobacteria bacterium]|nr:hypothetical protein [Deltaproteobacteria bacterium]
MRFVALLGLLVLWAAPAAAEQFGSFTLQVVNQSPAELTFTVNQGNKTTVPAGRSGRFGQGFDYDQLAASPDYLFQVGVSGQGDAPPCSVRVRVEVSAWGDDYLFSCSPRRELVGPCLLTCNYDNVGPNSRARLVYKPDQ